MLIFLAVSCKKDKLVDEAPSLIGNWTHFETADSGEKIEIKENGFGSITLISNGTAASKTKEREWFVKDNELFFGKAAFNGEFYTIDEYPKIAANDFINFFDTINVGNRYIILNDRYYVEKN